VGRIQLTKKKPSRLPMSGQTSNRYKDLQSKREFKPNFGPVKSIFCWTVFGAASATVLLVVSVGLLAAYRWMTTYPFFTLEYVEVSGNNRLNYNEVLTAARVNMGVNCLGLNMKEVEAGLLSSPWIKEATVKRVLPNKLIINVAEREVAFWVMKDGQLYYADAKGQPIAAVEPEKFRPLPMLELMPGADHVLAAYMGKSKDVDKFDGKFSPERAAWIRVGLDRCLEMYFEEQDLLVSVGVDQWATNFKRLNLVRADLERRGELKDIHGVKVFGDTVWVLRERERGA
jgi:cell division protein FtsQ